MLLNLSNHYSTTWLSNQLECATQEFGMVIDMPFPSINPEWDFLLVSKLAVNYFEKIITMVPQPNAVHVMGELTFTFNLVALLKASGITCIASTTNRVVFEKNGQKLSRFEFIRFREYY